MFFPLLKKTFAALIVGLVLFGAHSERSHASGTFQRSLHVTALPFVGTSATVAVPFVAAAGTIGATGAATGASSYYITGGHPHREIINAIVQDAGDFIASNGERKSAFLTALIATWREGNPEETSNLSDEDLVIDLLSSLE